MFNLSLVHSEILPSYNWLQTDGRIFLNSYLRVTTKLREFTHGDVPKNYTQVISTLYIKKTPIDGLEKMWMPRQSAQRLCEILNIII